MSEEEAGTRADIVVGAPLIIVVIDAGTKNRQPKRCCKHQNGNTRENNTTVYTTKLLT